MCAFHSGYIYDVLADNPDFRGAVWTQDYPWPQFIGEYTTKTPLLSSILILWGLQTRAFVRMPTVHDTFKRPTLTEPDSDENGDHDQLRFPPFHPEVLAQTWANPAHSLGRIKVIIAEGINHGPGVGTFERTKNLVTFSFQHAPLGKADLRKAAFDGLFPRHMSRKLGISPVIVLIPLQISWSIAV